MMATPTKAEVEAVIKEKYRLFKEKTLALEPNTAEQMKDNKFSSGFSELQPMIEEILELADTYRVLISRS